MLFPSDNLNKKTLSSVYFILFSLCFFMVWQQAPLLLSLNQAALHWITLQYSDIGKSFAIGISAFAHKGVIQTTLLTFIASLIFIRRWDAAVYVATLCYPVLWLCELLKNNLASIRPDWALIAHLYDGFSYSFPSRHVASIAILSAAFITLSNVRYRKYFLYTLSVLLGAVVWARLHLTAHWLTDVLGALFLSAAWGHLAHRLCPKESIPTWIYAIVGAVWIYTALQYIGFTYTKDMFAYTPFIKVAQHGLTTPF